MLKQIFNSNKTQNLRSLLKLVFTFAFPGALFHYYVSMNWAGSMQWMCFVIFCLLLPMISIGSILNLTSYPISFSLLAFFVGVLSFISSYFLISSLMWIIPGVSLLLIAIRIAKQQVLKIPEAPILVSFSFHAAAFYFINRLRVGDLNFNTLSDSVIEPDNAFWIGNAASYFLGYPPKDLRILGFFTCYHNLYSQFGFFARATMGLELVNSISYLLIGFFIFLFLLSIYQFFLRKGISRLNSFFCAFGVFTLSAPFFALNSSLASLSPAISAVYSVGSPLSWIIALAIFEIIALNDRYWLLLIPTIAALTGSKISTAMCMTLATCGFLILSFLGGKTEKKLKISKLNHRYLFLSILVAGTAFLTKKIYYDNNGVSSNKFPLSFFWNATSSELVGSFSDYYFTTLSKIFKLIEGQPFSYKAFGFLLLALLLRYPYYLLIFIFRPLLLRFHITAYLIAIISGFLFSIYFALSGNEKHFLFFALILLNLLLLIGLFQSKKLIVRSGGVILIFISILICNQYAEICATARIFGSHSMSTIERRLSQTYRIIRNLSMLQDIVVTSPKDYWMNGVDYYTLASALTERQSLAEGYVYTLLGAGTPEQKKILSEREKDVSSFYSCRPSIKWSSPNCRQMRTFWFVWDKKISGEVDCLGSSYQKVSEIESMVLLKNNICVDSFQIQNN
jgi:hypothetical protein